MKRWLVIVLGSVVLAGCGGAGDDGSSVGGGTGGGNSANPASVANCEDYCARSTQCLAELCEEDHGSPLPSEFIDLLRSTCASACTDRLLQFGIAQTWDCLFENSCRAVFADDVCQAEASYTCN